MFFLGSIIGAESKVYKIKNALWGGFFERYSGEKTSGQAQV